MKDTKPYIQKQLFCFTYNIDTRTAEQDIGLVNEYGFDRFYYNMPEGFSNTYVVEEDRELYNEMYRALDNGADYATADFRITKNNHWARVFMYRENVGSPIFRGVLQNVSVPYEDLIQKEKINDTLEESLKSKTLEALQLFTAISTTYDMIVSVNLTQNTYIYTPIEAGSFITADDAVEGVFDDIISMHYSKVVPQHKQMYLDSFSRQALLAAHAAGKKGVYLEYQQCDDDGVPHWLATYTMFTESPNGTDVTEITISQNIDERKQKEKALRHKELEALQLLTAIKDTHDMILSANLTKNKCRIINSEQFSEMIAYMPSELDGILAFQAQNYVIDEYKERFLSMFNREYMLNAYRDGKKFLYLEYQACGTGGSPVWYSTHVMFVEDPNTDDITAIVICQNIDERIRKEKEYLHELHEAKERAEASDKAKTTFLFNASHDIRTPMNAIYGFAQMIKENAENAEFVRTTVDKILASNQTLLSLLTDILELSKIEQGKEVVDKRPMDINSTMQKLSDMFASDMAAAGIDFSVKSNIIHSQVLGDEDKLTRMALNILSNAKKFTPSGGSVMIGASEAPIDEGRSEYTLYVRDNGIGMSKDFQKRAFEQFERERTSTESGVKGTGLGLAIVKNFCTLMGGECILDSELGKGTTVTVKVILEHAPTENDEDTAEKEMDVDFTGKRILLAEDNEFNMEIAKWALESNGFSVEWAQDGAKCVNMLLSHKEGYYDLILMDIQMPIMDGYIATKEIRNINNKKLAEIPIVAMTANAFKRDIENCLNAGMNDYMSKPFEPKKLIQLLQKWIPIS